MRFVTSATTADVKKTAPTASDAILKTCLRRWPTAMVHALSSSSGSRNITSTNSEFVAAGDPPLTPRARLRCRTILRTHNSPEWLIMNIPEYEKRCLFRLEAACRLTYSRYSTELDHGEPNMNRFPRVNRLFQIFRFDRISRLAQSLLRRNLRKRDRKPILRRSI